MDQPKRLHETDPTPGQEATVSDQPSMGHQGARVPMTDATACSRQSAPRKLIFAQAIHRLLPVVPDSQPLLAHSPSAVLGEPRSLFPVLHDLRAPT